MMQNRSVELTFRYSGNQPTLRKVHLHVPPGLTLRQVTGGSIDGGYEGDKPVDRCDLELDELHQVLCLPWERSSELGLTRVIGGIDPNGRLLLEGIGPLTEPLRLTLEVWSEEDVRQGEFADIEVVEHGILESQDLVTRVGGLTVRFQH